jgi:hypothetical protein
MPRNLKRWQAGRELHARLIPLVRQQRCPCCGHLPPAKDLLPLLPEHLKRDARTIRAHVAEIDKTMPATDLMPRLSDFYATVKFEGPTKPCPDKRKE